MATHSFKKTNRLLTPQDFAGFKQGATKKLSTAHLTALSKPGKDSDPRVGIAVSRAKRAVDRNWFKRQIREYFRTHKELFCGQDTLILVRDIAQKSGPQRQNLKRHVIEQLLRLR